MSGLVKMRLTLLLIAALSFSLAAAKSAEDYFHGGAYKYVAGKQQEALVEVEEGLRQYPRDPRLQSLASQLRKMKDQQNPDKNKNEKGDDKKKDQNGKDKKNPDQDKKDGEKKPDDAPPKNDDPEKKNPQQPDSNEGDKGPQDGRNPAGAPPPGQMSEDEAKRLLNSFADDEKKEQRERQKLLRKRMETDQDW